MRDRSKGSCMLAIGYWSFSRWSGPTCSICRMKHDVTPSTDFAVSCFWVCVISAKDHACWPLVIGLSHWSGPICSIRPLKHDVKIVKESAASFGECHDLRRGLLLHCTQVGLGMFFSAIVTVSQLSLAWSCHVAADGWRFQVLSQDCYGL